MLQPIRASQCSPKPTFLISLPSHAHLSVLNWKVNYANYSINPNYPVTFGTFITLYFSPGSCLVIIIFFLTLYMSYLPKFVRVLMYKHQTSKSTLPNLNGKWIYWRISDGSQNRQEIWEPISKSGQGRREGSQLQSWPRLKDESNLDTSSQVSPLPLDF